MPRYRKRTFHLLGFTLSILLCVKVHSAFFRLEPKHFSPNGDLKQDVTTFFLEGFQEKPIKEWKVSIYSPKGRLFRKFSGEGSPPDKIIWDGLPHEPSHPSEEVLLGKEGRYRVIFSYEGRDKEEDGKQEIFTTLDINPPQLNLETSTSVFSPNGNEKQETLLFYPQSSEPIHSWLLNILNEAGEPVRTEELRGALPANIEWDGINAKTGLTAANGTYTISLKAYDRAGNVGETKNQFQIRISTLAATELLTRRLSVLESDIDIRISLPSSFFSDDSFYILPQANPQMDELASLTQAHENRTVRIRWHRKLRKSGKRSAWTIYYELVKRHVNPSRIFVDGTTHRPDTRVEVTIELTPQ